MNEGELKKLLDQAEKNPRLVAAAVSGLPEKVLRYKPGPEQWCILEVLAHMADIEVVYAYRLRQMLADSDPKIAPMDQNAWAKLGYAEIPAPESIAVYGLIRLHNLRLLRNLKPGDLEKGAFHPELGRAFTVQELVQRIAHHGTGHLEQIERLKSAQKM